MASQFNGCPHIFVFAFWYLFLKVNYYLYIVCYLCEGRCWFQYIGYDYMACMDYMDPISAVPKRPLNFITHSLMEVKWATNSTQCRIASKWHVFAAHSLYDTCTEWDRQYPNKTTTWTAGPNIEWWPRSDPALQLNQARGHLNWRMGLPALLGGNLGCWIV